MENTESLRQVRKLLEENKNNEALKMLNKIVEYNKYNHEALCFLYNSIGKRTKAKEAVRIYIKIGGKDWMAYYILADVLNFEGFFKEALVIHRRPLKRLDADRNVITQKIDQIQEKFEEVINKPKLAFITANDSFLDNIVSCLSEEFWVRKYMIPSSEILIHKGAK